MLLITSKLMGEIICGVCIGLLVILIICAIVSKTPNKKDSKEVVKEDEKENQDSKEEKQEEEETPAQETESEDEAEEIEEDEEVEDTKTEEESEEVEEEETPAQETEFEDEAEEIEDNDDDEIEIIEEPKAEEEVEEIDAEEEKSLNSIETANNSANARYAGKYIITIDDTGYRFKLVASNGQSLIVSEAYTTEAGCRRGIDTIKRNVQAGQVKIDADKHNLYFFTLVSKQNRILAQSASYKAKDSAVRASESFKKFALTDNIVVDEESKKASNAEIVNIEAEVKDGGEYTIEQNPHGFIYVLKASNGVKIVTSQDYSSLNAAKEAYERFKDAVYNGEWQIVKDKNSNYQFKLYLRRRLVVAGELYQSKDQVKSTIASIKSWAKNATYETPNFENNQQ